MTGDMVIVTGHNTLFQCLYWIWLPLCHVLSLSIMFFCDYRPFYDQFNLLVCWALCHVIFYRFCCTWLAEL